MRPTLWLALLVALPALAGGLPEGSEPGASGAWLARAERGIAAREYEASESERGLQAPNRAHDLRAYFEATGIRVHARTAAGSPQLLGLSLSGVGRGPVLAPIPAGEVSSAGTRVEIRREGLLEWYENSPSGLEQGFTLAERPAGEGPLVVELAVARAEASARGGAVVFRSEAGRRLRYGELAAVDASGRALEARLEVPAPGRVRLVVEDASAQYPVSLDPLLTEEVPPAQLESDQAGADLGVSAASAGDVNGDGYADVIVGAAAYDAGETNEGAAFVFLGSATGVVGGDPGNAAAQLESDQVGAGLGSSVASAGDVNDDGYDDVIVGAYLYDAGESNEGAAFVFLGSAAGVADGNPGSAAAQLESDQVLAALGVSVASAGDVNGDGYADVIVGAFLYDAGDSEEGAAFVFLGSATGVVGGDPGSAAAQLESDQAGADLGVSVASAGDVNDDGYADVIVGAHFYDAGETDEGAAFVFLGSAAGVADGNPGSAAAQLESNQVGAGLGVSVASAGDVNGDGYADVIVGAVGYDAGETDEGAAFVFLGSAAGVADGNPGSAAAQLESNQADANLSKVASAGDVNGDGYADVIVGASTYDAGETDEGAAFVFLGSAAGVVDGSPGSAAAQLESDQVGAGLGVSVASAGDVNGDGYADVITGARFYDAGEADEGAAFVFLGSAAGIADGDPGIADAQVESDQADARLGWSAAPAGDVNGDGYADVIVGAYLYDAGEADEGAAFVFLGSSTGIANGGAAGAAAQLESDQVGAYFGYGAAGAGDVNGDGYADVIAGAYRYAAGQALEGAAFVFLGSASGIASGGPDSAAAQLESDQAIAQLGFGLGAAGDVNGDGYSDVIVGAHGYDAGEAEEGAAFVFLGSAAGIAGCAPGTPPRCSAAGAARLESDQADAELGVSAAGAGDVNGDGYADVIAGAWHYDAGEPDEGAAFVFLGSATGVASGGPASAAAQLESDQASAVLGWSAAGAGDVNGDGYADVIAGAYAYTAGHPTEGAAFVFLGSAAGLAGCAPGTPPRCSPATAAAQLESDQIGAVLGLSAAGAGDVNGDGYADVVVGAPYYSAGETAEGAAFVFLGSATGIVGTSPASAAAQLESNQSGAQFGRSAAGAGDVDGDGYADVIVGASAYDAGQGPNEGAAFVYLGGAEGVRDGSPATAAARLDSNQASASMGESVAGAGDVNGDGYADVIVGAPGYDAGQLDEGAAFVFLGSASGIADGGPATAAARLEGNQASANMGWSVAGAGDVNGDGYADVIVGAFTYDSGQFDEGAAFVFLGSPSGVANGSPATAAARLESDQAQAFLGDRVAGAGDVNGDGYADVIVGAYFYSAGQLGEGAAFVFLGSASAIANGSPASAATRLEGDQADAHMGRSVAGAGDVNGDGYADVIAAAYNYDAGQLDEGAAFVFLGSASGIANGSPATAATRLEGDQASAYMGHSVAGAGDVNGDGHADLIVGAMNYSAGQPSEGAAFVFLGSASGIANGSPASASARLEGDLGSNMGFSVSGAGDVNGDGYADAIVGAHVHFAGELNEGAAFVFLGSASGIANGSPASAAAQLEADQASGLMGRSVAGAGDVNGDGHADVIVGAPGYDAGQVDEGAALVFLGNGGRGGRPVLARQLRGGGSSTLVQPWGSSADADDFKVRLRATHPDGRGRAKLEIEACPAGVDFFGAGCVRRISSSWADVTATSAGTTLTETVPGLSAGALYRWRARVLHAPYSITQPGISAPANPPHGPWRRLAGQAVEGDIRPLPDMDGDGIPDGSDSDIDGDGLDNAAETGTYGTDPLDADSEDDGLLDGAEVALGTDPLDPDSDGDLICDGNATVGGVCSPGAAGADNCPLIPSSGAGQQANSDGLSAGDLCQCGDVTGEGIVNALDLQVVRQHVVGATLSAPLDPTRCSVIGTGDGCDVADAYLLDRLLRGQAVGVGSGCSAFAGP